MTTQTQNYASSSGWQEIENMQGPIRESYATTISKLILKHTGAHNRLDIIDLGCGRAYVSQSIIEMLSLRKVVHYMGVDRDPHAILTAQFRMAKFGVNADFWLGSINSFDFPKSNVLICLSNTLISFGDRLEVKKILNTISSGTLGIFSVSPHDPARIAQYRKLKKWSSYGDSNSSGQVRLSVRQTTDRVYQHVEFKTAKGNIHKVNHSYLRFTKEQIELFFDSAGWDILERVHPFTGQIMTHDQMDDHVEYLYICKRNK